MNEVLRSAEAIVGQNERGIYITPTEAQVIGTILVQKFKMEVDKSKMFKSKDILPFLKDYKLKVAICEILDLIKPEQVKKLNLEDVIPSIKRKLLKKEGSK